MQILFGICCISFCFMIFVLYKTAPVNSEYIPPEFDTSAVTGMPEVSEEYGWSEIYEQGMNYSVGICKKIINIDNKAKVYVYNSENNNVWLRLRILDENDEILGQSGLIKPGEYVEDIELSKKIYNEQKIKIKIMSYQKETYYSEGSITLNTNIQKED